MIVDTAAAIRSVLKEARSIAVVGLSASAQRPSFEVEHRRLLGECHFN